MAFFVFSVMVCYMHKYMTTMHTLIGGGNSFHYENMNGIINCNSIQKLQQTCLKPVDSWEIKKWWCYNKKNWYSTRMVITIYTISIYVIEHVSHKSCNTYFIENCINKWYLCNNHITLKQAHSVCSGKNILGLLFYRWAIVLALVHIFSWYQSIHNTATVVHACTSS